MSNQGQFAGKTVWVTGASSGIGETVARAFASQGAKVLLIARSEDRLIRITNEIKQNYQTPASTLKWMFQKR